LPACVTAQKTGALYSQESRKQRGSRRSRSRSNFSGQHCGQAIPVARIPGISCSPKPPCLSRSHASSGLRPVL
jgi:hypothetical protein